MAWHIVEQLFDHLYIAAAGEYSLPAQEKHPLQGRGAWMAAAVKGLP